MIENNEIEICAINQMDSIHDMIFFVIRGNGSTILRRHFLFGLNRKLQVQKIFVFLNRKG